LEAYSVFMQRNLHHGTPHFVNIVSINLLVPRHFWQSLRSPKSSTSWERTH
jgi:hypothetical protein